MKNLFIAHQREQENKPSINGAGHICRIIQKEVFPVNFKQQAIDHLNAAIAAIRKLNPIPDTLPGPIDSESGKAAQAKSLAEASLGYLLR